MQQPFHLDSQGTRGSGVSCGNKLAVLGLTMASGRGKRKNRSGKRVSDKSLLIKRTPHAFAFFLAHMKERACAYKKVRLHGKTTVWRMDLLSLRYRNLKASEKQIFMAKSQDALARKSAVRLQKLQVLRGAVVGPSQSSADADAAVAPAQSSAVADAAVGPAQSSAVAEAAIDVAAVAKGTEAVAGGSSQLWLSLAMPGQSPGYETWHHNGRDLASPAADASQWPLAWQWVERPSGVHRDLVANMPALGSGSYGCCLAVKDRLTGESFCLKVPRPGDDRAETSLKHEFRVLSQVAHTNVMRAAGWAISRDGKSEGFLMPLADGNLWQWLEACVDFTRGHGVSALVQIARGLSFVHYTGIVHLDLKPENIVTRDYGKGCCNFQIADFGQSHLGANGHKSLASKIASDMVNATIYRPLHLFHAAGSEVSVCFSFDLWAFGCIVFDVMQRHPRWRSADGRVARLFSGVKLNGEYDYVLRVRNYRLIKMLEKDVAALVIRCQPDHRLRVASDRRMRSAIVVEIMGLAN